MNKKMFFVFPLMIFSLVATFAQDIIDKPVAIVKLHKTEVLSLSKFVRTVRSFEAQEGTKLDLEQQYDMLDVMIDEMLILQDAEEMNLYVSDTKVIQKVLENASTQSKRQVTEDELRAQLRQNNIDYNVFVDMYRKQMMIQSYISRTKGDLIRNIAKPTEADIQKFYTQNKKMFIQPDLVRFSQIFFNTMKADPTERKRLKDLADNYVKRINGGTSFESVLAEIPPNQANGDKGFVPKESPQLLQVYGKNFDTKLFSVPKGQVVVIASSAGYHVIKITDKQANRTLTLDDNINPMQEFSVRKQVANVLYMRTQQEAFKQAYSDLVAGLTKKGEIRKFPKNIQL